MGGTGRREDPITEPRLPGSSREPHCTKVPQAGRRLTILPHLGQRDGTNFTGKRGNIFGTPDA